MGESYDGRAAVPSISREGVTQQSCRVTATQSIIKVTEQSARFGRGGVTAFTERRVTGVLGSSRERTGDMARPIQKTWTESQPDKNSVHAVQ